MTRMPRSVWVPLVLLAAIVFGWGISSVPLTNWDEGIYANVNLELWQSHDWTKLTYFGQDFLEKPPLQFWLSFVSFGVFGPTELAIRMWSVLAGIGTVVLLAWWMWQLTGRRWLAWLVGAMFVLGRYSLLHAFRTGDLDGLLTFFIVAAMYSYWCSWRQPKWLLVWGAASAAAVMTKSLAGAVPLVIVGIDLLLSRGWRTLSWRRIGQALLVFVALAAPWHVIETVRFGSAFWQEYLGWNIVERSASSLFTPTPWYFYLDIISDRMFPFSFVLPVALWWALTRVRREALLRLLVIWVVAMVAIYSLSQTRRDWYLLPVYPALVVMVGVVIRDWWSRPWPRSVVVVAVMSLVAMFGYQLTDFHFRVFLQNGAALRFLTSGWWAGLGGQAVFGGLTTAVLLVLAYGWRRRGTFPQRLLVASGSAMLLMAMFWTIQHTRSLPTTLPLKSVAARLDQERLLEVQYIGTKLKKEPAGYFYLLRLPLTSVELPVGTLPQTPIILTTTGAENAPLNTRGRVLLEAGKFRLIDFQ